MQFICFGQPNSYNIRGYGLQQLKRDMINEQEQQEEIVEPLPDFGEIEGQQIKLAGLDYSLLQQQTAQDKKANLMKQIKSKLSEMAYKMPLEKSKAQAKCTFQNDQLTKNIMMSVNLRPSITQSTFYLFPTQTEFAPHLPELITRRFGRMHTQPLYLHHSEGQIQIFKQLLVDDDKRRRIKKEQLKQSKKIISNFQVEDDNDSDDIFAGSSDSNEAEQNQEGKTSAINISVGNKLSFEVNDSDIFGGRRYKEVIEQVHNEPKVIDKYDFLRKKVKLNDEDGYGECYAETGPSLEEMKQLKKEGIQLFGDAKQFTKKERKININRDYQKIKKIIEQKQKAA